MALELKDLGNFTRRTVAKKAVAVPTRVKPMRAVWEAHLSQQVESETDSKSVSIQEVEPGEIQILASPALLDPHATSETAELAIILRHETDSRSDSRENVEPIVAENYSPALLNPPISQTSISLSTLNEVTISELEPPKTDSRSDSTQAETDSKLVATDSESVSKTGSKVIATDSKRRLSRSAQDVKNDSRSDSINPTIEHTQSILPPDGLQRRILYFVLQACRQAMRPVTPPIMIKDLANYIGTSDLATKNAVHRAIQKDLLIRVSSKNGRGGWATYSLPESITFALESSETDSKTDSTEVLAENNESGSKTDSNASVVSSCFSLINTTTTTRIAAERTLANTFKEHIVRYQLDDYRLTPNDLIGVWRKNVFEEDLEAFLETCAHLGFYLKSKEAEGIKNPKAWFIIKLSGGYFDAPHDFVSWEDRQREARDKARQQRQEKAKLRAKEEFEQSRQLWLDELSEEQRVSILRKLGFSILGPYSKGGLEMLQNYFMENYKGREETTLS